MVSLKVQIALAAALLGYATLRHWDARSARDEVAEQAAEVARLHGLNEAQRADLITLAGRLDDQAAEAARLDALLVAARAARDRLAADHHRTQRRLAQAWAADSCAARAVPVVALCVLDPTLPACGETP
jgi:hypothetical protein